MRKIKAMEIRMSSDELLKKLGLGTEWRVYSISSMCGHIDICLREQDKD